MRYYVSWRFSTENELDGYSVQFVDFRERSTPAGDDMEDAVAMVLRKSL